jgi:hypothetical protein
METFRIAENLVPVLMGRLGKIQKKASKLGSLPLSVREVGSDVEETPGGLVPVKLFQITGSAPKAQGWSFVGTLDHTVESGVILRVMPGETLPEEYRCAEPVCDHCQTVRRRKATFIVRDEFGDTKQVGRQCLRDFLGGNDSPEDVARLLQYAFDVESLVRDASGCSGSFDGFAVEIGVPLQRFLAVTAAVIEERGWVSRKDAYDGYKTSTSEVVRCIVDRDGWQAWVTPEREQLAEDAIEWARSLRDKENVSDYEHNVAVVAEGGVVTTKLAGIAASIIPVYQKALERERTDALHASMMANSRPLGEQGKRVEVTVTVLSVKDMGPTEWGSTRLVKMVTSDGCACCWFSSRDPGMDTGKTYRIVGTIKRSNEYKGIIETALTRCRVL